MDRGAVGIGVSTVGVVFAALVWPVADRNLNYRMLAELLSEYARPEMGKAVATLYNLYRYDCAGRLRRCKGSMKLDLRLTPILLVAYRYRGCRPPKNCRQSKKKQESKSTALRHSESDSPKSWQAHKRAKENIPQRNVVEPAKHAGRRRFGSMVTSFCLPLGLSKTSLIYLLLVRN